MSLFGQPGYPRRMIGIDEVKLCAFCGALNYHRNTECFTCGWRGAFEYDAEVLRLAWQRLFDEYESVEMDHLTGAHSYWAGQSEAGSSSQPSLLCRIQTWWRRMTIGRRVPAKVPAASHRPTATSE
ncbi:MAG: hypothetical protein ACLQVD_10170 [Capsulimonadaceae bacterium]